MFSQSLNSGLNFIGDISWGSHICQFYQNKNEILDTLIPFFKAGLENNEYCVWITSETLNANEALDSLSHSIPEFKNYIEKSQIEVIDYDKWYLKDGEFRYKEVLANWISTEKKALIKGHKGLRASGNLEWADKSDWGVLSEYEKGIESVIDFYNMTAICSYPLSKCKTKEIIDITANHKLSILKEEQWVKIESSIRSNEPNRQRELELEFRSRINELFEEYIYICSGCKKVHLDKDWIEIEQYIHNKLDLQFSHGICPDCIKKFYPTIDN